VATVVELLREPFGAGRAALHGPGPAVHATVAGIIEIVQGDEIPGQTPAAPLVPSLLARKTSHQSLEPRLQNGVEYFLRAPSKA
jgi:hypothetical protein